jgi:hypothetical protein
LQGCDDLYEVWAIARKIGSRAKAFTDGRFLTILDRAGHFLEGKLMQVRVLTVEPTNKENIFQVAVRIDQKVEHFLFTVSSTFLADEPAFLTSGDAHFERTLAHSPSLQGQLSKLVSDVFLRQPIKLPAILDDSRLGRVSV